MPRYAGIEFTTPPIKEKVTGCFDLFTRKPLAWTQNTDGTVHITGLDRESHPADTVVSVVTQGSIPANPPR